MKKWNAFLLVISFLPFLGCNTEEIIPISIQCSTGDAMEITTNTAILKGTAVVQHAKDETGQAYFYYSTTAADSESLKALGYRVSAGSITSEGGFFSASISGLNEGTLYYYMAVASIDGSEEYGDIKSFVTISKPKELTVTGDASEITETHAVLSGYANLNEDYSNAEFGIIYSKSSNPSLDNGYAITTIELDSNNKYVVTAYDLEPNTVYYYKSFVSSGSFLRVGEVKFFKTLDFSVSLTTQGPNDVSLSSARVSGYLFVESVDSFNKSVGFIYSDTYSDLSSIVSNGKKITASLGQDGQFACVLSDLSTYNRYYYVAYAQVYNKTYYGDIVSFMTLSPFASGEGTQNSPFIVNSALQFNYVRNFAGCYFEQNADFTLDNWIPIGTASNPFVGHYNGNGHTITADIQFWYPGGDYWNNSSCWGAGIWGYIMNSTIENLHFIGSIGGYQYVGGLCGHAENCIIKRCTVDAEINCTRDYAGGICGGAPGTTISECSTAGTMYNSNYEGGISSDGTVIDCYSTIKFVGKGVDYAISGGTVTRCYYAGEVQKREVRPFYVTNTYYDTDVMGTGTYVLSGEGFPKTTTEMKRKATFVEWDFNNIWVIDEGVTYPRLRCFE